MNYLDGLLASLVLAALWLGHRRGLIALLAGWIGRFLLLIGALLLTKPLALWAGPRFGLNDWLTAQLIDFFPRGKAMTEAEMGRITAQKLPQVLDKMGLPPMLKFKMMEQGPELMAGGSASVTALIQEMAATTALWLLQGLILIALLLLGGILLKFLVVLTEQLLAGTIFGSLNRLLGLALNAVLVLGLLVLAIGLTAPLILAPATGEPGSWAAVVQGSYFYPRFLEAYGLLLGALISHQ